MTRDTRYELITAPQGAPIKAWTLGVPVEEEAKQQLRNIASLPFIYRWIAVIVGVVILVVVLALASLTGPTAR